MKKILLLLILFLIYGLVLPGPYFAVGQEAGFPSTRRSLHDDTYDRPAPAADEEQEPAEPTEAAAVPERITPIEPDKFVEEEEEKKKEAPDSGKLSAFTEENLNQEIKYLNEEIQSNRQRMKQIQDAQKKYADEIKKTSQGKASLNNQLALLDNRTAKLELDIELVEIEVERTNLEIAKTNAGIESQKLKIEKEMNDLGNIMKLLERQDRVSALEILLLNNSLAEFLNQVQYLEDLNKEVNHGLGELKKLNKLLEKEMAALNKQSAELGTLKIDLEKRKAELSAEKDSKVTVLAQLNISERQYQLLLERAKAEQEEAAAEIASMEKLVRAKIAKLEGEELQFNDQGFIWPVQKNVVTAYFHDPTYPFRYIFEHPGVDIRAAQGTPVRAAAGGYVARAKNGGAKGYSYIMIVHGDGLSTVYGHVSRLDVKDDDYVNQGQIIGLSGGLPGTPGAGTLSTGPHMHFEIRLNGIPVDPLAYLP